MAKKYNKVSSDKTKIYNPTARTPDTAMNNYGNAFTSSVIDSDLSNSVKEYPAKKVKSFSKDFTNSTGFSSSKNSKNKPSYK